MISIIRWLRGHAQEDKFTVKAREDQKRADYPGCQIGAMRCRSQSCGCNERKPSERFVEARARFLRGDSNHLVDAERHA